MNFTKATDEQIKTIIEGDVGVPTPLLKQAYEEAVRRRTLDKQVCNWIIKFFKTKTNAERKTGLPIEDLLWISYDIGFGNMRNYKPTHPFAAFWYRAIIRKMMTIAKKNTAQKRTGEVYSLEDTNDWKIPGFTHVEQTVLNKIYIENLLNQLTETEKEIVVKLYQGYLHREIAQMQGISKHGLYKRIRVYQKRLQGA